MSPRQIARKMDTAKLLNVPPKTAAGGAPPPDRRERLPHTNWTKALRLAPPLAGEEAVAGGKGGRDDKTPPLHASAAPEKAAQLLLERHAPLLFKRGGALCAVNPPILPPAICWPDFVGQFCA